MKPDDIKLQLDLLREQISTMNQEIHRIREKDVRWVFGEQIRPILKERAQRFFERLDRQGIVINNEERDLLLSIANDEIDQIITVYQQVDKNAALATLVDLSARRSGMDVIRSNEDVKAFFQELDDQFKTYYDTEEVLERDLTIGPGKIPKNGPGFAAISPETIESALGPLSSSVRFKIMTSLKEEKMGLTEISKSLELKKGHLQFHIKNLVSSGYITMDRKSRLYSLTPKGTIALEGTEDLVRKIISG